MNQRSSAWPLALVFTLLVLYASLYPFEGWRFQGAQPLHFLAEPWPRYWTRFDVVANALGYAPLGFLIALGMLRSGAGRWCQLLMLLCLASCLTLLNSAPDSPYFEESLHLWEQGRFIRFHGLSQWLGWIWPFAALWVGLRALARPPTPAAA